MYIPKPPSGYQSFKKPSPSGSGGTLGSVMSKAKKLKQLKEPDKTEFQYGIHSEKCQECPGCGLETCYYMGIGPADIDCANKECRFYKPVLKDGEKRYHPGWEKPYEEE